MKAIWLVLLAMLLGCGGHSSGVSEADWQSSLRERAKGEAEARRAANDDTLEKKVVCQLPTIAGDKVITLPTPKAVAAESFKPGQRVMAKNSGAIGLGARSTGHVGVLLRRSVDQLWQVRIPARDGSFIVVEFFEWELSKW